ncbi:MAG TPA: carbohydrate kinase [Chloroflexi bacterium]|nr:carbohydrate kinase [Chloroflexota bacterium]
MILCVTLNPLVDMTLFVDEVKPVYRINAKRVTYTAGGKGNNAARALVRLGEPARVLEPLGGFSGQHEAALLASDGVEAIIAPASGDTRVAVTVVDRDYHQQAFFTPAAPFTEADVAEVRKRLPDALKGIRAVCLCGSSPGPLADPLFPEILREAASRGIPSLLDTYGDALRLGLEAAPTIVKINRDEAAALLGHRLKTREEQLRALDALRREGVRWVILTLGAEGALFNDGSRRWIAHPPPIRAINPIGSGDAMTAGLLAGLVHGQPPEDCFRFGMAAAAASTARWEACAITSEEVEALLPQVLVELL